MPSHACLTPILTSLVDNIYQNAYYPDGPPQSFSVTLTVLPDSRFLGWGLMPACLWREEMSKDAVRCQHREEVQAWVACLVSRELSLVPTSRPKELRTLRSGQALEFVPAQEGAG